MDEQAIRAMVREALARQAEGADRQAPVAAPLRLAPDASHYRYALPESATCIIEPTVECVHCGYCQSHGH